MKFSAKTIIQFILSAGVGAALIIYFFSSDNFNVQDNINTISKAKPFWVAVCAVLTFAGYYFRALRWRLMLHPFNPTLTRTNTFWALMAGYFANLFVPRLGEVTRCFYIKKTDGIPVDNSFGTVITERIADVFALLTFILIAVIVEPKIALQPVTTVINLYVGWLQENAFVLYLTIAGLLITIIALILLLKNKTVRKKGGDKIVNILKEIKKGIISVKTMRHKEWFIIHTFVMWLAYLLLFYCCFFCLEQTGHLGIKAAFVLVAISGIGLIIPVPAAIGAFYFALKSLELYDVNAPDNQSYTLIIHSVQLSFMLVTGGISFLLFSFIGKKKVHAVS